MMSSPDKSDPPRSDAERAYRRKLEALVEACLARVRSYELPDDAEPAPAAGDWRAP